MRSPRLLQSIRRSHASTWVAVMGSFMVLLFVGALVLANANSDRKDTTVNEQLDRIQVQLRESNAENERIKAESEQFRTQMLTSIQQLYELGQQPLITSPGVVPERTTPVTTTTLPPIIVTVPPQENPPPNEPTPQTSELPPSTSPPDTEPPTTEPPATLPPSTEPPTTEPPVTEPPTTEPPTTEPPPEETTTTTEEPLP